MIKNKKFKMQVVIISIIAIIASSTVAYFSFANNKTISDVMKLIGISANEIRNSPATTKAIVNGESISDQNVNEIKAAYQAAGRNVSDQEILDSLIEKKLLYNDAIKNGVKIDDQKVDEILNSNRKAVESNPEEYENLKGYLSGLGMDEKQYWEGTRETYRKMLVLGEFKNNVLKAKFKKENGITDDVNSVTSDKAEIEKKFAEYYKNYVEELKKNATIELK